MITTQVKRCLAVASKYSYYHKSSNTRDTKYLNILNYERIYVPISQQSPVNM